MRTEIELLEQKRRVQSEIDLKLGEIRGTVRCNADSEYALDILERELAVLDGQMDMLEWMLNAN